MKRLVAAVVCVGGLVASAPVQAAPILIPRTDTIIGTIEVDTVAGTQTRTITGGALVDIFEGATIVNTGGLDADAVAVPAANDAFFFDLVDEMLLFDFNLGSSTGIATPVWSLLVVGVAPSTITDPVLAAFLVPNNVAVFSLLGEPVITTDDTGALLTGLFTYSLDSIAAPTQVEAIPEPATIGLVGMGILAAARSRRARRKNDVA